MWRGSFSEFYGNLSFSLFPRKAMLKKSWQTFNLLKVCQKDGFLLPFVVTL